ncbi:MAG: cytochrome c peroxidase [Verrucomicrobiota bacterium]
MKTGRRGLLAKGAGIVLAILLVALFVSEQVATIELQPSLPKPDALAEPRSPGQVGFPADRTRAEIPFDNPQTPEKIALGEKLFFDGRLSADGTVACASCHNPDFAFTDRRPRSVGIGGRIGQRNAPTLLNALYNQEQFWDGRAASLEQQAGFSITNSIEMGQPSMDAAVAAIAAIDDYPKRFLGVFGRPPNARDLARAIAAYERTLYSFNAPFDHFLAGDKKAISDSAKRGWTLFNGQAYCNRCHAITIDEPNFVNFTDYDYHNTGVGIVQHRVVPLARQAERLVAAGDNGALDSAAIQSEMSALGRFLVTKDQIDIASFKTPACATCW